MKNIAIVSNTSWYIYNFRKGLIKKLVEQGYTVFAIAPADKFVAEISAAGAHFIELTRMNNKGKNPFQDIGLILELRNIFKSKQINCCLFFTPKINIYGSIAIKFTPIRAIATINGLGFVFNEEQPGWLKFTVRTLYRFAFRNLSAVFFQNEDDRRFFEQRKMLQPGQTIEVVKGSGVNIVEFEPKSSFNPSDKLVFLLCSRLLKEKGLYEYFKAAENVKKDFPGITFALLGLPANNPSAVSLDEVNACHEKGFINYWGVSDKMSETLNQVDVMVLPSYYREGVPRILIEGLAKGLPIITTNNVGCKETIEDGRNGYMIPVRDVNALEAAIRKMISLQKSEREQMGIRSRQKAVNEFDETLNHQSYINTLSALTG